MPRKRPNLKRRLDDLRGKPALPIDVRLSLDAELYQMLKRLAEGEGMTPEAYIAEALADHLEHALGDEEG